MAGPHDPIQQGEAALRQGDAAAALAQFRRALARSAKDVRALIGCGIACGQSGDLEQATRYLERAAALAPQAAAVHANLSLEKASSQAEDRPVRSRGEPADGAGVKERAEVVADKLG
jgi:Flp pilus assembly protein TadD